MPGIEITIRARELTIESLAEILRELERDGVQISLEFEEDPGEQPSVPSETLPEELIHRWLDERTETEDGAGTLTGGGLRRLPGVEEEAC